MNKDIKKIKANLNKLNKEKKSPLRKRDAKAKEKSSTKSTV